LRDKVIIIVLGTQFPHKESKGEKMEERERVSTWEARAFIWQIAHVANSILKTNQ